MPLFISRFSLPKLAYDDPILFYSLHLINNNLEQPLSVSITEINFHKPYKLRIIFLCFQLKHNTIFTLKF